MEFKAGDYVKFVWNGILNKAVNNIHVVEPCGNTTRGLFGNKDKRGFGAGHKFEKLEVGFLRELNLAEGDVVVCVSNYLETDAWSFGKGTEYPVEKSLHHGFTVCHAPVFDNKYPITQLFAVTYRKPRYVASVVAVEVETKKEELNLTLQKKKLDHSNSPIPYNVSGWGNTQYAIPLEDHFQVFFDSVTSTFAQAAKKWKVCTTTAWSVSKSIGIPSDSIIKTVGDYDKNFRMRACIISNKLGVRKASEIMGCSKSSIYYWLKAYNMTNSYFNPQY
jgi:hypothetical protein